MRGVLLFLFLMAVVLLGGCGGSGGGSDSAKTLTITTSNPNLRVGQTTLFTAFLEGGRPSITWTVVGGDSNGTIKPDGTYTAPATAGTYSIKATVTSDSTKSATATVVVSPGVSITITGATSVPKTVPFSQIFFAAPVTGSTDQGVTWTVNGLGSLVDANGVFTAPTTLGSYTVVARSKADPTKTASATVTVVANLNVRMQIQGKSDIVLSLRPDKAPKTVANFVTLVNKKFYDGILFHRYVANFVIQGGDPKTLGPLGTGEPGVGNGDAGYKINFEPNDLLHDKYALAMALSGVRTNTAGSQFYITLSPQPTLDGDYCVFGHLLTGDAVVDSLRAGDKIVSATTELP